jgi:atlastin
MSHSQPLQIITTGDSETDYFVLRKENLAIIIDKIPDDAKVAIVSVVGAFRTGKSFLLNFFLRYLRANVKSDDNSLDWMISEGEELTEGNMNEGWNLVDKEAAAQSVEASTPTEGEEGAEAAKTEDAEQAKQTKKEASFAWRGGKERQTTGIWMWSEPFIREKDGEKIAILLMDTQGMFDNETTMTLTAQIFGLSTLVSSFQIYNVDKRIQEDNLQHLALFSEYGRLALTPHEKGLSLEKALTPGVIVGAALDTSKDTASDDDNKSVTPPLSLANTTATTATTTTTSAEADMPPPPPSPSSSSSAAKMKEGSVETDKKKVEDAKPFQALQFLVRDWQNFEYEGEALPLDEEDRAEGGRSVYEGLRQEMKDYLDEVLRSRGLSDLQSTREQILRCFEVLDCFMLPHPGFAVTKKSYDGAICKIDTFFRSLLNKYVRSVFNQDVQAKTINNRKITGKELQIFFEVYVKMFQTGEKSFPKAMTMLDATAEANNRSAFDLALHHYKAHMEQLAGTDKAFVKEPVLSKAHETYYMQSMTIFDEIATMGASAVIVKMRDTLKINVEEEKLRFFSTNSLRNPFKDVELYAIPLMVAAVAWFLAVVINASCSHDVCEAAEDGFVNVYLFILFGMLVLMWKQIRGSYFYLKEMVPVLMQGGTPMEAIASASAAVAQGKREREQASKKTKATTKSTTTSS